MNSLPSFNTFFNNTFVDVVYPGFLNNPTPIYEASLHENFCGNSESSDYSLRGLPKSSMGDDDLFQIPPELCLNELESSDDDIAALMLNEIASSHLRPAIEEEPAPKRPCSVLRRVEERSGYPFAPDWCFSSLMVTPEAPTVSTSAVALNSADSSLLKDARALLGLSMLLTNTLPPNIDSMGLVPEDLQALKYYSSIKKLCVAIRNDNVVTLIISELFDGVIYKYINSNKSSLALQLRGSRFRYWNTSSKDMFGAVKNYSKHSAIQKKQIMRTFTGVNTPGNVFFKFSEHYDQIWLGKIFYQGVSNFIQQFPMDESFLVSEKRLGGGSYERNFTHIESVKQQFLRLSM